MIERRLPAPSSQELRLWTWRIVLLLSVAGAIVLLAWMVGRELHGPTTFDADISDWFLRHRTSHLNDLTDIFGQMASSTAVVGLCLVTILACVIRRRLDGVGMLVAAMLGEIAIFLSVTALVHRARPAIPRLDPAPPTSSFPSGHTFATFVVWWALYFLACRQHWASWARNILRIVAIVLPFAVAVSRVYRGMHHPTDTVASLLIGTVWISVVVHVIPLEPGRPEAQAGTGAGAGEAEADRSHGTAVRRP